MDSINMLNKNALKNLLNNYSEELKENDIEGIYKKIHDLNTTDDMKLYLSTLSDSLLSLGFTGEQIIERYGQDIVPKFLFINAQI